MARNHDGHSRLMEIRNQVVRDKATQTVLLHRIGELKARGYPDLIASLQKEIDLIDKRITRFESEIMGLETRLFGK